MKTCRRCRRLLPIDEFSTDRSRADGHSYVCRGCRYTRTAPGPSKCERRLSRAAGLAWCSRCGDWRLAAGVRAGLCRTHRCEAERERYAADPVYRAKRRRRVYLRKRGVDPVPPEGAAALTEKFGGRCAYCPAAADTWDHVYPVSRGGRTTPGNVVPACASCNSTKKATDVNDWITVCPDLHPAFTDHEILAHCGLFG